MKHLFRGKLPAYLVEAWGLGVFMISACLFTIMLEHPLMPLNQLLHDAWQRRIIMGIAMGFTGFLILASRWGKISGAHINPAVTLTMLRLGRISKLDACMYIPFQILGGLAGVWISSLFTGNLLSNTHVDYAVTIPGIYGIKGALLGESCISVIIMTMVLIFSSIKRLSSYIPAVAGILIGLYVILESPFSGFGMNPARTLASAIPSGNWNGWWIYMTVPVVSMLAVAEVFIVIRKLRSKFRLVNI